MQDPGRVLVVDDSEINRVLLTASLQDNGYVAEAAEGGEQALQMVQEHAFDLILLDLVMPGMDGFEVMKRMQEDESLRHIPIIVVSAMSEVESIARCIEMGAVDYMLKPFNPVLLRARLASTLARKRFHDAERAHLAELKARNEELDAFAATVAHDLKSPMSGIVGFSSLALGLLEDQSGEAVEEIKSAISRITGIVERVDEMIQGLLLLARVPVADIEIEPVSMELVLYGTRMRLQHAIDELQAKVVSGPEWPDAMGYEPWLAEVWANYMGNALKYGGRPPRVEVGATRGDGGLVRFWVKDNGPGISAEDMDKLFKPFSRLNKKDKQKGHGLGLSIVQRIVEKLGGSVGVDSEPGAGSTFWFELPEAPDEEDDD